MGVLIMEPSKLEQMSNTQLIDYHLEQGEGSFALSKYVQRLTKDSNTVWVEPPASLEELNKIMQLLSEKSS
jgi:hypothetical protein